MPSVYLFRLASGLVQIAGGSQTTVELLGATVANGMTQPDDYPGHDLRPHRSEARDRPLRQPATDAKNSLERPAMATHAENSDAFI